jgi:hypothetical protein
VTASDALLLGPVIASVVSVGGAWIGGLVGTRKVRRELEPNGGNSIKDQLNRQDEALVRVETRLNEHIQYHLEKT